MDIQKDLIAEFDRECDSTRKLLNAIPEGADFSWKPHDKSMELGRLANHVADTCGNWAIHTLTTDRLDWTPDMNPTDDDSSTKAGMLAVFDQKVATAKTALAAMTPEKWDSNWKMVAGDQTWIDDTKYNVFRTWVLNHMIHHRAQLGVYLRLLGAPIPGMYGPSADQMPPAEQTATAETVAAS
ncbi:MAG TPA: DinB family protein [Terracidiphilus sp.]